MRTRLGEYQSGRPQRLGPAAAQPATAMCTRPADPRNRGRPRNRQGRGGGRLVGAAAGIGRLRAAAAARPGYTFDPTNPAATLPGHILLFSDSCLMPTTFARSLCTALLLGAATAWLPTRTAAAQMRDSEPAAPRTWPVVLAAPFTETGAALLREVCAAVDLLPEQLMATRRVQTDATDASTPGAARREIAVALTAAPPSGPSRYRAPPPRRSRPPAAPTPPVPPAPGSSPWPAECPAARPLPPACSLRSTAGR